MSLNTITAIISILWLFVALYYSVTGQYLESIHALAWVIVTAMTTRFDKNA